MSIQTVLIQAFTGRTSISQLTLRFEIAVFGDIAVQLNYLAVASDLGKVFGVVVGACVDVFPALDGVLFTAAFMGSFGYGVQWLVITNFVSLPYMW
ncbi:hypothetical protein HID58_095483 [Brassica napus]|uniref:Nodulin-like domain-containing protein n=1 Tax=Brassica napus TaxID=3708 RepID=A0ABQ7X5M3_BRANA|nr:hypothetical protein HID58_095483 [Brassica napus]